MRARAATTQTLVGTTWGSYGGSTGPAFTSEPPALTGFSAATPEAEHAAGWLARVHLDRQGRPEWRSGEELAGFVELERVRDDALAISSVIVRAYWQSTTVFTAHRLVQVYPDQTGSFLAKLKPASSIQAIAETKAEWHRSHLDDGGEGIEIWSGGELAEIRREVEGDFPLLGGLESQVGEEQPPPPPEPIADGRSSLPFAFVLPTSSRVTSSNVSLHPPPDRRDLQIFARTPPASIPGSAGLSGVVEWVVEVLVRFQDTTDTLASSTADPPSAEAPLSSLDELPSFSSATDSSSDSISSFGFLSPAPHLLVHRVVFPFEPLDLHTQDMYSSWRPNTLGPWSLAVASRQGMPIDEVQDDRPVTEGWVPQFGRDPRDEALGGSNMGTRRVHRGVLVEQEGGKENWSSFEKRMAIKSTRLGRVVGWVRAEVSVQALARLLSQPSLKTFSL